MHNDVFYGRVKHFLKLNDRGICVRDSRLVKSSGGEHWDFRFCGFGYILDRFFDFCAERLRFWCSLRFADFSFFSLWFSVFVKNTSGFSVLVSDVTVVFGFSSFVLFGLRFLFDLSGNS